MRQFTDSQGRTWEVKLTLGAAARIKAALSVDLLTGGGVEFLGKMAKDPFLAWEVLWVLVADQAKAAGISKEAFAESLDGDTMDPAHLAFMEAFVDFFPPAQRTVLRRLLERAGETRTRALTRAAAKLEALDLDQLISGGASGNGPA